MSSDGLYQSVTPEGGPQRPPWAVSLSKEALFRIQLSLASRRSSVMVLETVCRIFIGTLSEHSTPMRVEDLDPGETDWNYQTTGVPGLLVEYQDIKDMTIFSLKLVVIELESGLCTWEGKFGGNTNYQVFAEDFHTFWLPGIGHVGIEFGDLSEGERMRVLLREWLERLKTSFILAAQQETDNSLKKKKKPSTVVRSESQPRFDKKQISSPCNFIHVSGITMTRTHECEKELQGSVRRFFRGAVSSLTRTNTISPGSKVRSTLRDKGKLSVASSLGDLSASDSGKLSLPNGGVSPDPEGFSQRTDSSASDLDKKFSSLQRKKKGTSSRPSSPGPPETSESANQSNFPDSASVDNITPNSRRKALVQSRVITYDDYSFQQEQPQRRSTVAGPPDRSRLDQRKFSAPNIRSYPPGPSEHSEVLRQHSQQIKHSDAMYGRAASSSNQSAASISQFPVSESLPPYRHPPRPYPTDISELSIPVLSYPQEPEPFLPPPIPYSLPLNMHSNVPLSAPSQDPALRSSRYGQARVSERRDLKRLSNSYTSFGHVGSTQVDV